MLHRDPEFKTRFLTGLGDPSGFYFPVFDDVELMSLNKQIREEALPVAYASTRFQFKYMEELIHFLLAIGRLGRRNIEALDITWDTFTDHEFIDWRYFIPAEVPPKLPLLHAERCVGLLKQCERLKYLHVRLEEKVLNAVPMSFFEADPGILGLCSLPRIPEVEVTAHDRFGDEPEEILSHVVWLKEKMQKIK